MHLVATLSFKTVRELLSTIIRTLNEQQIGWSASEKSQRTSRSSGVTRLCFASLKYWSTHYLNLAGAMVKSPGVWKKTQFCNVAQLWLAAGPWTKIKWPSTHRAITVKSNTSKSSAQSRQNCTSLKMSSPNEAASSIRKAGFHNWNANKLSCLTVQHTTTGTKKSGRQWPLSSCLRRLRATSFSARKSRSSSLNSSCMSLASFKALT